MTKTEAKELFKPFLLRFKTSSLKAYAEWLFDKLPDYWFYKPASSTGKYHPSFANKDGGLALHTLYACNAWDMLFRGFTIDLNMELLNRNSSYEIYEIGLIAVIFHDALKYGDDEEHTTKSHDIDSAIWIKEQYAVFIEETNIILQYDIIFLIAEAIEHHMGPWSTTGAPNTLLQQLVFIADYMASSKIHELDIFK